MSDGTPVIGSEFLFADAVNVLAMPLDRWENRAAYRIDGGWSADLRKRVYSNGSEQGFALERAETVIELGPMLGRVLKAGVAALADDSEFQAYIVALYSGDREAIVELEGAAS